MGILDAPSVPRRKLQAASRRLAALRYNDAFPPVMTSPPTIAWTNPGGTSPINAGSPRRVPWTSDQLSVFGGKLTKYSTFDYGANQVNGSWTFPMYSVEFDWYSAQASPSFAVRFRNSATNGAQAWLWIAEGTGTALAPATSSASTLTASASNSNAWFQVTFASAGQRRIRIYMRGMDLAGLDIHPTDAIGPVRPPLTRVAWLGDSWVDSATGATSTPEGISNTVGRMLGVEMCPLGQGGTGYVNAGSALHAAYGDAGRLAGLVALDPDLIIVSGTSNDDTTNTQPVGGGSWTTSDVGTAAGALYAAIASALPGVPLIVTGPPTLASNPVNRVANSQAIRAACAAAANVLGYIDQLDPTGHYATAPVWAASTVYAVGDYVNLSGLIYECIVAHTSGVSFSSSSFTATTWITGNGKVGSTNGSGNSDFFIQADATHPSQAGHDFLARRIAEEILRLLTSLGKF